MSRLEQIERQIKELRHDELRAFRDWFAQFDAEAWDRQIESDANGKLEAAAERALRDHERGLSTEL